MTSPLMPSESTVLAEIIAIGNELLLGIVQDTNTHWLCNQIAGLGGVVKRATLVPDEPESIGEELLRALDAGRDLVLLTGGLGPTEDDRTLKALAHALRVPLRESHEAVEMVRRRYQELADEGRVEDARLTESRRKMGILPQDATPLLNRVGTAPGVLIRHGETTIVSLPGVPPELRDIFRNSLQPHLARLFGAGVYQERHLVVELNDESRIAPLLREMQKTWTHAYIKSRPRSFQEGQVIWVTLAMRGERPEVQRNLDQLTEELEKRLGEEGLATRRPPSQEPYGRRGFA